MNFERSLTDSYNLFEQLKGLVSAGQIHEAEYQALLDVLTRAADEHPRDADRVVQLLHKLLPPAADKQRVYVVGSPDVVSETMRRMAALNSYHSPAAALELIGLTRHGMILPLGKSIEHDLPDTLGHWPDPAEQLQVLVQAYAPDAPAGLGKLGNKFGHLGVIGSVDYPSSCCIMTPAFDEVGYDTRVTIEIELRELREKLKPMPPQPRYNGYVGKGKRRYPIPR
jgi:hypothetical protein